jgi:phage terminase Nu1 subunit (DNA packaging protein)
MSTQAEVCAHLGIKSATTLKNLIGRGIIPAGTPRGGLDLDACRIAYITYLRNVNKGIVTDAESEKDEKDYDRLLDKERWRKMKRENDVADGVLVEISVAQEKIEEVANAILPILESIVPEVKRSWPDMNGDQAAIIEECVNKCLNSISNLEL